MFITYLITQHLYSFMSLHQYKKNIMWTQSATPFCYFKSWHVCYLFLFPLFIFRKGHIYLNEWQHERRHYCSLPCFHYLICVNVWIKKSTKWFCERKNANIGIVHCDTCQGEKVLFIISLPFFYGKVHLRGKSALKKNRTLLCYFELFSNFFLKVPFVGICIAWCFFILSLCYSKHDILKF